MNFFRKLFGERVPATELDRGQPENLWGYGSVQGIGKRSGQQDYFLAVNVKEPEAAAQKGMLLVVADGMGGSIGGDEASETAARFLEAGFNSMDMQGNIAQQLLAAVLGANEAVYAKLGGDGGTTLAACIVYDKNLYFASVGDSAIYLLRGDQLSRLNREHSIENMEYMLALQEGKTDPEGAGLNLNKAALTHHIGMRELDDVDFLRSPMLLFPGDVLLLCSDGLDCSISQQALLDCMHGACPEDCCRMLEEEIKGAELPYQDNYTGLILKVGD